MAKYYYKTLEDSPMGKMIAAFWKACRKAEQKAEKYAKNMGASEFFFASEAFAGGVDWLVFAHPDRVDKERWKEGEPIDGTRVWLPNVTTLLSRDADGNIHTTFDSPYKEAKRQFRNGKRTNYSRGKKQGKYSKAFLFAVRAEKDRMELPVIGVEKLCEVLKLKRVRVLEQQEEVKEGIVERIAPTFFNYDGYYYISCDYPSESSDMELINFEKYRFNRNMALNAQQRKERLRMEQEKSRMQEEKERLGE